MSGWTNWRALASDKHWSDEDLDWDGPACYELALSGPRGGSLQIVYVGETESERRRIASYAAHGSHLRAEIDRSLRQGWTLCYRARATGTKAEAVAAQNALLNRFNYDWNIARNCWAK